MRPLARPGALAIATLALGCPAEEGTLTDGGRLDGASLSDRPTGDIARPRDGNPGDVTSRDSGDATAGDAVSGTDGAADAGACTVTPVAEAFRQPQTALHWRATAGAFVGLDQVCSTPVVANIVREAPDDGRVPEVAFMTFSCASAGVIRAALRVISGRAPNRLIWSQNGNGRPNDESAPFLLRWDGHPAAADLDGIPGNGMEIVAVTLANGLIAYRSDGTLYWQTAEATGTVTGANPSVSIADLDADGVPEVVAGASVFNGRTGAVRWVGAGARGVNGQGPLSVVADLDADGRLEVIAGQTVYESDGRLRFGGPMAEGFAAVGDLLDARGASGRDGVAEVIVVHTGTLSALDRRTGAVRWSVAIPGGGMLGGAPTVADFDGDGAMEVGVAGASAYSVFDPGCRAAGGECAAVNVRWSTPTQDASSAVTSSTVFDFNGDGSSEVVYNDEERFQVLDGRTGRVLFSDWNPSQTRTEQAIVADADGDGHADIVFGANQCAAFAGDTIPMALQATERVPGLEIWSSGDGSWVGARDVWNEHGYHIDNVGDDGQIPRPEPPSFMGHNTFRLNRARERVLYAPDLAVTADTTQCTADSAEVCVTVHNRGDARAGSLTVGFYDRAPGAGVAPLGRASTTRPIDPRGSERVCARLPLSVRGMRLIVRVDDGASARECNEDNNLGEITVNCGPS